MAVRFKIENGLRVFLLKATENGKVRKMFGTWRKRVEENPNQQILEVSFGFLG